MGRIGQIVARAALVILAALGIASLMGRVHDAVLGEPDPPEPPPDPDPDDGPEPVEQLEHRVRELSAQVDTLGGELRAQVEDALETIQRDQEAAREKLEDVEARLSQELAADDDPEPAPSTGDEDEPTD